MLNVRNTSPSGNQCQLIVIPLNKLFLVEAGKAEKRLEKVVIEVENTKNWNTTFSPNNEALHNEVNDIMKTMVIDFTQTVRKMAFKPLHSPLKQSMIRA